MNKIKNRKNETKITKENKQKKKLKKEIIPTFHKQRPGNYSICMSGQKKF